MDRGIELYKLMMQGDGIPGLREGEKVVIQDYSVRIIKSYSDEKINNKKGHEIENYISESGTHYLPLIGM